MIDPVGSGWSRAAKPDGANAFWGVRRDALERKGIFNTERLAEAERFAMTEYLITLAGPPPKGEAARAFYARVAEMTGLPEDLVAKSRGFIRDAYVKNLRAGDRKIVSR